MNATASPRRVGRYPFLGGDEARGLRGEERADRLRRCNRSPATGARHPRSTSRPGSDRAIRWPRAADPRRSASRAGRLRRAALPGPMPPRRQPPARGGQRPCPRRSSAPPRSAGPRPASSQRQASRPSRLGPRSGSAGSCAHRARQFRSPLTGESPCHALARCSNRMRSRQTGDGAPAQRGGTRALPAAQGEGECPQHRPRADEDVAGGDVVAMGGEVDRLVGRVVELLAQGRGDRSQRGANAASREHGHAEVDEARVAVEADRVHGDRGGEQEHLGRDRIHAPPVIEVEQGEPELPPGRNGQHPARLPPEPAAGVLEHRLVGGRARGGGGPRRRGP